MTGGAANEPSVWSRTASLLPVLGPPATVLGALLIYFGWARSNAQAKIMGLDVNLFGYAPQDYVLLSIEALYMPLLWLFVVGLLWTWLDGILRHSIGAAPRPSPPVRHVLAVSAALVTTMLEVLVLTVLAPMFGTAYLPYFMALGVLLAAWAVRLYRCTGPRRDGKNAPARIPLVEAALVLGLVSLLLFWGTTNVAKIRGWERAQALEHDVADLPRALLYSTRPLHIGVDSVTEVKMGTASEPLYRYNGLRLLTVSGERYFFLHDDWTVRDSRVVVLPDDGSVRVEYGN
jgi:hypothetical protein